MIFLNSKENDILNILDSIEDFLDGKINELPAFDFKCSKSFESKLKNKLDTISTKLTNKNNDELQIYGELMLVCEKIQNGDLSDKIYHTNTSNIKLNYIAKTINKLVENLNTNFSKISSILNDYSHDNFLEHLDTNDVHNDFKSLFEHINDLNISITKMLLENKENVTILDESSHLLLKNVDVLNRNSNSAAASLEQTAAAIEEITSIISSNTNNVIQMSNFANNLSNSANEGQELAQQTTLSMDDINTQVTSINEAITIIDQIAFQTNILSLNAAVEAATAGEAGKGFAVVAQEVRNLATRSAEAAKDIKDLVEKATSKANHGKEIADKMIHGYGELNENISRTTDLIKDIEMSSKEQVTGIQQINDAISSLDKQTQQNANIASEAYDIAIKTDKVSKVVVANIDSKQFNKD